MKNLMRAYGVLLCACGLVQAQLAPGTHFGSDVTAQEVLVLDVGAQGVFERGRYPVDVSGFGMPRLATVDPSTGELLGVTSTRFPPYDNAVARFRASGNRYVLEALFYLGTLSIYLPGGANTIRFDDDGLLYYGDGGLRVAIDLERQSWSEVPFQQRGALENFVPAKAGRPRVEVTSYDLPTLGDYCYEFSVVNSQGFFVRMLRQFCGNSFTNPIQGSITHLETTPSGRTFYIGDFYRHPSGRFCFCLKEIDWTAIYPVIRDIEFDGVRSVAGYALAEGLGKLYCPISRDLIPQFGMATLDLRTGEKSVVINPAMTSLGILHDPSGNWFPQNVLTVFPRNPSSGSPFSARMSMGGEIGDFGMIVAESAVIAGQTYHLQVPVVWGQMDSMGLGKTRLPYDPILQPMNPGDSLTFRGYRFDGTQIIVSDPRTVTWQ